MSVPFEHIYNKLDDTRKRKIEERAKELLDECKSMEDCENYIHKSVDLTELVEFFNKTTYMRETYALNVIDESSLFNMIRDRVPKEISTDILYLVIRERF